MKQHPLNKKLKIVQTMKKLILTFIIFFFSISAIFSQEVVELKLPKSDKIVIKLMFKNGSVCDPVGKEGLTNFTANLITSGGTKDLSYSQIQEKIYPMAAYYNVSVDKEVSIFTFVVHKNFIGEFYPVIRDLILQPSFSESDFERVKSNNLVYVEQSIRSSSDEEYSKKALEDFLFRGTRYQHMTEGTISGVKSITLDDVKNQYKNFFTKMNLMIGIAGNYTNDFLNTLKADMDKLPSAISVIDKMPEIKIPLGINVEIISKKKGSGSAIFMGFPMNLTRSNDEFAALMVANSYLGEHRKSYGVLYNKLRETRSMNYGDYSYIEWYDNGGFNMLPPAGTPRSTNYFSIWIRPVQTAAQLKKQYKELENITLGHAHYSIRLALREVDRLVKEGLTQEEFNATKEFLISYTKLYAQSPSAMLGYLMDSRFYGRQDYLKELGVLLAKLTLDDVNKAIKKYWQIQNMFITIITEEGEAGPLKESLLKNAPSPMSYSNLVKEGLPQSVLQEDEQVSVFPLNIKSVVILDNELMFK
jgi:zinc protease